MTAKKIYGPWIKWHGGECPVPPGTIVKVRLRNGFTGLEYHARRLRWNHYDDDGDIVEYCVAIEQADLDYAEKLLLANGYTITPPAKPLTFEDVVPMTGVPPKGKVYWAVHPFRKGGVESYSWKGDEFDRNALRHRMAYLDKEHALVAARHIFGLKGGEL